MNVTHLGSYVKSPRVARWKKVLGVFAVLYVLMPFDAIPDAIPLLGWLDDLGVLGVAVALIAKDMAKHARRGPADEVIDVR